MEDSIADQRNSTDQETDARHGCCRWVSSVRIRLYSAHAITTWGDRMWAFAVALFLIKMSSNFDLRLTAIFGLVCSFAAIIFGASIGKWIDHTPRFTAATKALVIQNSSVVMCATVVCIMMNYLNDLKKNENQWIFQISQISVIIFGAVAYLAGMASNICISKDWVVVIAKGDREKLASFNAVCRRIDLTTKICSPLIVGCIMAQMSDFIASVFIAVWNVVSMMLEYYLLRSIYKSTPELAIKHLNDPEKDTAHPLVTDASSNVRNEDVVESFQDVELERPPDNLCSRIKKHMADFGNAWTTYFKHPIFPAGLGLACLYMTVLAFDGITIGYAYSQGVTEAILGALGGAGAIVGIVSTLFYPVLRKKIGIERTGLIGFFAEVSSLVFCVVAVWAPGSPFDPQYILSSTRSNTLNVTWPENLDFNSSLTGDSQLISSNSTTGEPEQHNYTSVILMMTGIIGARFGLWLVDLSVNQILQEEVEESNRGAINGVQHALNMFMDLIKYGLVILLPSPETFGFLSLVSFTVICAGWASYAVYSWKKRRHILPFHQYFHNCVGNIPPLQTK